MRRIRFKARALKTGKMVEGYYAHQHIANFDADGQHIIDYDEQDWSEAQAWMRDMLLRLRAIALEVFS